MSQATMIQPALDRKIDLPDQVAATRQTSWQGMEQWRTVGWTLPIILCAASVLLQTLSGLQPWFLSWPGLLVMSFAAITAMTDSIWCKIPNWMTYSTALAGLAIGAVVSLNGPSALAGRLDLGEAAFGLVACFVVMLVPFRASGGGAGDVKLAAAYGALLGWQAGLSIIITAYIVAGAGLLIIHLASSQPWMLPKALLRLLGSSCLPQLVDRPDVQQQKVLSRPIPLAAAFAVAFVSVLCGGNFFAP